MSGNYVGNGPPFGANLIGQPNGIATLGADGKVPVEQLPTRVAFSARRDAPMTMTNNTYHNLAADNIELNEGGAYSAATGEFTAPVTGAYYFSGYGGPTGGVGGSSVQVRIQINGAYGSQNYIRLPGAGGAGAEVSLLCLLAAGAKVKFEVFQDSGSNQALATGVYTRFQGFRVY